MSSKLIIIHNLPSGGGLRMINNIANRYSKNHNVEIHIIGNIKTIAKIKNVKYVNYKIKPWSGFFKNLFWTLFYLPKVHKRIASRINKIKNKSLLVTHDYFTKSPYILRYLKGKIIYLCQEPQREFYESSKIHTTNLKEKIINILRLPIKYIDLKNVQYANIVISNSKYSKKVIDKIYNVNSKIVYPGIDNKIFIPKKNNKLKKQILCVGGINPVKNQLMLVKAIKPLLQEYKLVLVGDGKKKYIDKLRKEAEPNLLYIKKNITEKELVKNYQESMAVCIPARLEPFGLSSIESQSCGTPVVIVKEGGLPETLDKKFSKCSSSINYYDFRKKINYVLKNNKELRKKILLHDYSKWSWQNTLKKLDNILLNESKYS